MSGHPLVTDIPKWLSPRRFEPYLAAADGDADLACSLYEWGSRLSSAAFEAIHYFEVVLRNAIDEQLRLHSREQRTEIPWLFTTISDDVEVQKRIDRDVAEVRSRLRRTDQRKDTRAQIVAGLSLGFWVNLLGRKHETLWRQSLHRAFPKSSGRRSDVSAALTRLLTFRNRVAHHDSLLTVDVGFHLTTMLDVLRWVDPLSSDWLSHNEQVTAVLSTRPAARPDVVVVAAREAWPLYQAVPAYVCQAGRTFQPVDHLAFYTGSQIQPEIPRILHRIDDVEWSSAGESSLRRSGSPVDLAVADVIHTTRAASGNPWPAGRYQVFLLTRPGEQGHLSLGAPIPHSPHGPGSAFTRRQRYVVSSKLQQAVDTTTL